MSSANTNFLINIIKATILSKIDYGLVIYEYSNKKNLQTLSSIYNSAIRRSLGAFYSTLTKIMSDESGVPTVIERRELLIGRLITKLSNPNKSIVKTLTKSKLTQKKEPKRFSALSRTLCFAKQHNIPVNYPATSKLKHPPWRLETDSVNISLST